MKSIKIMPLDIGEWNRVEIKFGDYRRAGWAFAPIKKYYFPQFIDIYSINNCIKYSKTTLNVKEIRRLACKEEKDNE